MPIFLSTRRTITSATLFAALLVSSTAHASQAGSVSALPILLGKQWAIGYAIVFLCILLGVLAVAISSMRKALRKRDGY